MRLTAALVSAALLGLAAGLVLPAGAQHEQSAQPYQVRVALGDIPTTAPVEPSGWNVVQSLSVTHTEGTATVRSIGIPAGQVVAFRTCTCPNFQPTNENGTVRFTIPAHIPSGSYVVALSTSQGPADAFSVQLDPPADVPAADRIVIVYVPDGSDLVAPVKPGSRIECTMGTCTIATFEGGVDWFSIHPDVAGATLAPERDTLQPMILIALGVLTGIVLWGIMVQKGWVQRRRKQEVTVAAHKEAARAENVQVLEARKRALMAALKEIEVARMQNEIDVATFEHVKGDLKRQTVTVLRAIEEGHAAGEKSNGAKGA